MEFYYKDVNYDEASTAYINKLCSMGIDYTIKYIWDFETDEELGIEITATDLIENDMK